MTEDTIASGQLEHDEFPYSYIIELGFEVTRSTDSVFTALHGFEYFYADLKLTKKVSLSWDPVSKHIIVFRKLNQANYKQVQIRDKDHLMEILTLYNHKKGKHYKYVNKPA